MTGAVERVLARLKEQRARLTEIGMEEKRYLDQCRSRVGYLLRTFSTVSFFYSLHT